MRLMLPLLASCLALASCSEAERDAAADADGNGSMNAKVASASLGEKPATIDCSLASGQAEQAVCSDAELTAIDKAFAALSGEASPNSEWTAKRSACARADDLRSCLLQAYAERIHDLAAAGSSKDEIVIGPVVFRCGDADLAATFINSDPGLVHLRIGGDRITLPRVVAASGAKYEGSPEGNPWIFWNKGREAMLVRAGGEEVSCAETSQTP